MAAGFMTPGAVTQPRPVRTALILERGVIAVILRDILLTGRCCWGPLRTCSDLLARKTSRPARCRARPCLVACRACCATKGTQLRTMPRPSQIVGMLTSACGHVSTVPYAIRWPEAALSDALLRTGVAWYDTPVGGLVGYGRRRMSSTKTIGRATWKERDNEDAKSGHLAGDVLTGVGWCQKSAPAGRAACTFRVV
jgi:hypothetical protein